MLTLDNLPDRLGLDSTPRVMREKKLVLLELREGSAAPLFRHPGDLVSESPVGRGVASSVLLSRLKPALP